MSARGGTTGIVVPSAPLVRRTYVGDGAANRVIGVDDLTPSLAIVFRTVVAPTLFFLDAGGAGFTLGPPPGTVGVVVAFSPGEITLTNAGVMNIAGADYTLDLWGEV